MQDLKNTTDPIYSPLNENDVVDLILSSTTSFSDFNSDEHELAKVIAAYSNYIKLAFASTEDLEMLGYEKLAASSLFNRVTTAFNSILPFLESLGHRATALFDKRRTVMDDRKALEDYMHRLRSSDKNIDPARLKQLNLFFYEYKSLINVLSTLNHSIAENDKYLKNILSSRLLSDAFKLGYTTASDSGNSEGYDEVQVDSKYIKCHPVQVRFFENNTLDDLIFITDQLSRSCSSLEMMLMHDTQFKNTLSNLKSKPNKVKSLVGNVDAIMKLGGDVNVMTNHCGRIVNNVALLLKVNKTLTTVTKDVWENVLNLLDN